MARTTQMTQVGKQKIEISNLDKVLWPDDGVVKAELIEYYLKIAPTILTHIKGRPLSFVRFPDGIYGESFFQKNRPDWAPPWLDHERVGGGEDKLDYVFAKDEAHMVWIANHACLEVHQIHARRPRLEHPDYVVFDLDPPEGYPFVDVVAMALELREHVEPFGYHIFVKTTGNKGVHIVAPLEPKWSFDEVFAAAKAIAQPFVRSHRDSATLHIKKDARQGKVLVDVFRNRPAQTIVAPYSVRGSQGAPVSMPLSWEALEGLENPRQHNLRNVIDTVVANGDAWEAIGAYSARLHTDKSAAPKAKKDVGSARTHKTHDQLESYAGKRSFDKTPEPRPQVDLKEGSAFVVHRHHASRLHYDLRLEQDGVLKSWAVPKGLPPRPGIKRLAVNVEDHPLEYLTFEGVIPKGEYGAGPMWVYASGKFEVTNDKKDSFYFWLSSPELTAEYRLINTKGKDWLLERVDKPQIDWVAGTVEPMLAESRSEPPSVGDYLYEVKWDGIRASISIDEGEVTIRTRSQRDVTASFPELTLPDESFRATSAIFDGEIVCLDDAGRPIFTDVMGRIQARGERGIERARARHPAVCYLFDCLYLDGRPIVNEPLTRRREWLTDAVKPDSTYRVSEVVDDGRALFEAAKTLGLEGIMAKDPEGTYLPGRRSDSWVKIKVRQTTECLVLGFTEGKGDRKSHFGALHLGWESDKGLTYLGKVGSGFNAKTFNSVLKELKGVAEIARPIDEKPVDDAQTVWIEPRLMCEVQYASLTNMGTLREPVFIRMRADLTKG
jgi:bifunctional non-homologous end joining protein LigD